MTTTPTTNYGFSKITAGTEKDIWGPIQSATLDAIDTQIKNRQNEIAANLAKAGGTMTGKLTLVASAVGGSGLNYPTGVAPSAPNAGDVWTTTTNLLVRLNSLSQNVITDQFATFLVKVATPASAAGSAGLSVPHGAAPSSPANGDVWSTTAAFFGRLNGATVQFATITDLTTTYAPLASPALTGNPTAPTASPGDNDTSIATTAFVTAAVAAAVVNPTSAEIAAGTLTTKQITPSAAALANNEVTLTDGATVTVNFAAGINFSLVIGGNRTLAASGLAAALVGRSGYIKVTQDATGSRTLDTSGATWKHINSENIVLSTGANQVDYLFYTIISATTVFMSIARNVG